MEWFSKTIGDLSANFNSTVLNGELVSQCQLADLFLKLGWRLVQIYLHLEVPTFRLWDLEGLTISGDHPFSRYIYSQGKRWCNKVAAWLSNHSYLRFWWKMFLQRLFDDVGNLGFKQSESIVRVNKKTEIKKMIVIDTNDHFLENCKHS